MMGLDLEMGGCVPATAIKVETSSYECDEPVAGPSASAIVARMQLQSQCSSDASAGHSFAQPSSSMMLCSSMSKFSEVAAADRKARPYACPGCPETFRLFRQRKEHVIAHHDELLSKKQRSNHLRKVAGRCQVERCQGQGDDLSIPTVSLVEGPGSFLYRIEQLSPIKLHRFLIEYNLKALKQTARGMREEFQLVLHEFSQRRTYFCSECRTQFTTMREYRRHMRVHPVQCHTCDLERDRQMGVVYVADTGHRKPATTTALTYPPFVNWRGFVEHQKMHLGLKEENTCKLCHKVFSSSRKLGLHTSSVHRRKAYLCTFCPRTFMHVMRLKEHKQRHHFNFNKVTVSRSLVRGSAAADGVLTRQNDYLCPCGEVFHSAAKFAWHKETHEKQPKGCLFCRERFVHRNSLSRHIRLAHPEKYGCYKQDTLPCPVCNGRFIRTSLKTHMASHLKRAEYQCSICSKVLSTKWNLKIHRWTHNSRNQMPFKCGINTCPKAFMRKNDLQTHMNTHKAIRPFTCDYCGCQFSRKYNWVSGVGFCFSLL